MRWWPWRHKRERDVGAAAREAVEKAQEDWPKVREVAQRAERLKERNGFGEAIVRSLGGKP